MCIRDRRIPHRQNLLFRRDCEADGHSTSCLFRPVGGWEQPKEPPTVWHYGLSARYGRSKSDVLHLSLIHILHMDETYHTILEKGIQSKTGKNSCKGYIWTNGRSNGIAETLTQQSKPPDSNCLKE